VILDFITQLYRDAIIIFVMTCMYQKNSLSEGLYYGCLICFWHYSVVWF